MSVSANPEQGEVEVVVDGQTYVLKMSMRAAKQLQKRNKKTIGELMLAAGRLDYDAICELMYALLQHYHADEFKTEKSVEDFLDRSGGPKMYFDYGRAIDELEEASKAKDVEGAQDPQTAQAGTGDSSRLQLAESA